MRKPGAISGKNSAIGGVATADEEAIASVAFHWRKVERLEKRNAIGCPGISPPVLDSALRIALLTRINLHNCGKMLGRSVLQGPAPKRAAQRVTNNAGPRQLRIAGRVRLSHREQERPVPRPPSACSGPPTRGIEFGVHPGTM